MNTFEKAAAKTAGAAKVIKAEFKGIKGVFKRLMQEHGEVGSLMSRVSKSSDVKVRRELYPKIRTELLSHERGELVEVYPVLSRHPATREIAAEHEREAGVLEATIRELDAIEITGATWGAAFEHLFEMVKQHVADEEGKYFPKAQGVIGEDEAEALDGLYQSAKKAAAEEIESGDAVRAF